MTVYLPRGERTEEAQMDGELQGEGERRWLAALSPPDLPHLSLVHIPRVREQQGEHCVCA